MPNSNNKGIFKGYADNINENSITVKNDNKKTTLNLKNKNSIKNNIADFFNLLPSAQAQANTLPIITTINDTKIISIPANLQKGKKYILSYKFDAPDISPEFYVLGPLEIGAFKEARQWQIANDQAAGFNYTYPDAGAPGMNLVVSIVGSGFAVTDSIVTNSSGNITVGPIIVADTNGNWVTSLSAGTKGVLTTVFYIHPNATQQDVQVNISGVKLPSVFKIINPSGTNDGNFSGFTTGVHMIGNGRNGTRTVRGTIVLDSLIIPDGVKVIVNTTDLDPDLAGNQGYFPVTIIVDGPVNISGILNVSGVSGILGLATDIGGPGGNGGPGGGGGGGGSGETARGGEGGDGFTGGGGGGCEGGASCATGGGSGGNGTGSLGKTNGTGSDIGGSGGNSTSPIATGGEGGTSATAGSGGGGGGTGFFFGSGGVSGGAGGSGGGGGGAAGAANAAGGGGFGTAGGAGTASGSAGSANGNAQLVPLTGGSGGGGGGNSNTFGSGGGGGGGAVLIVSNQNITIMSTGQILALGGNSNVAGGDGGSGSGGGIVLQATNVSLGGTLNTGAGTGGTAGGLGRIRIDGLDNPLIFDWGGVAGSNFTGPSIKNITDVSIGGTANASDKIVVYVQQKSGTNTTFNGTADANGLFDIEVTWYTGTNYIAVIQNSTVDTYTVMSSAAVATYDFAVAPDNTPPVINITNLNASDTIRFGKRLNISTFITGSPTLVNFTFNLTGNEDLYNFSYSVTGANVWISQNITVNVTRGNVINASVVACDASNNCAINSTNLTIANAPPPTPTILSPVVGANTSQQPLELNVTFGSDADGDAIANIRYYVNGKLNQTSLTNTTFNASDGVYILNVSISDGTDSSANATANFTLDTVAPVVGLVAPVNNSNSSGVTTFTFRVSSTLTPTDACQLFGNWSSNGFVGNQTENNPLEVPLENDFAETIDFRNNATYVIWNVRCNDTALNYGWNSSNFTLNIDYTFPQIALVTPANNTFSNGFEVDFSYIQTEAKPKVCQLWTNFSGTWKPNQTDTSKVTGIPTSFDNKVNITTGNYIWNVGCNDTANNLGFNETNYTLRVDSNAPVVNATLNKSILQIELNDAINLTVNVSDDNSLSFGQVIVNDTGAVRYFNFSLSGTSANFGQNITVSCSPCIINFTARVNDTINNLKTNDTIITVTPEKEITNCTNLDIPNTNYSLTQDANSGGTCFHVLANNVTLDCHGFEINYSQSVVGYGINISSYNYSTIRSCNIAQADLFTDTLNSYGVYVNRNSSNNVVFNNTITTSGTNAYGVYLFSTVYSNNIYSNNITTRSGNAYGVYLNSIAYNNSVYSNTIITIGSAGSTAYGVYLNSIAYNNSVYSNNITTRGSDGIGIRLETSAYSNLIYNNVINTSGGKTIFGSLGVYLTSTAYNNSVYSNTITTRGSDGVGVYLFSTAYNNSVYSNTITTNGSSGIGVYLTSTVYSNNIYSNNITTSNTFSYGIYLNNNVFNNTIYDNNITTKNTTSSYGIYLSNNVNNNTFFRNSISSLAIGILVNGSGQTAQETTRFNTFTNDTILPCSTGCADNYFDIVLTANVTDITFTNVSMNKSRIAFVASSPAEPVEKNNMTVRWFLDVNVRKSTDDTALQGAQVVINDSFSSNVFTGNTDANSAIPTQTVTEFTMNGSVTLNDTCINIQSINITCFNPYNITVNLSGYERSFTSIDVNRSKLVNVSLVPDTTPPTVNTTFNITSPLVNDVINFSGNITDNVELSTANITYNVSGVITYVNYTISGTTASIHNITTLTCTETCVINFTMYATDKANNVKQNSTLIIIPDTTAPVVNTSFNISSPVINDVINFTGNVTDGVGLLSANWTYNMSGSITKINYTLSGTSVQVSNITTITVDGGSVINFTLYVTDVNNNVKQNSTLITVADRTFPVVNTTFNISSPLVNDVINFSGNITDNVQLLSANITYNISGVITYANYTISGTRAEIHNVTTLTCVETCVINFTMYATDTSNNVKQNSTLIIIPDTTPPIVNTSLNKSLTNIFQNDFINITANVTDALGLSFCQFIDNQSLANGAKQFINKTVTGTSDQCSQNYTIALAAGNVINFTVVVNDTNKNFRTNDTIITVASTGNAPVVYLLNESRFSADPVSGDTTTIRISFNATDPDDVAQINGTNGGRVIVNVTLGTPGDAQFRTQSSCTNTTTGSGSTGIVQFNCTVNMRYYDNSSANWLINITVIDSTDRVGRNDSNGSTLHTFTYNALAAFSITAKDVNEAANLNFSTAFLNEQNVQAKAPILLNNTGNSDFDQINITAAALIGVTTPGETIASSNFAVNATNNTLGLGMPLSNSPQVIPFNDASNATLLHGPGISGDSVPYTGTADFKTKGNQTLIFWIDVPSSGLSAQTYNNTWNMTAVDLS